MLNYSQRLNLYVMIGAQRGNAGEMYLWWDMLDQIALSEKEKESIQYKINTVNGMEQATWSLTADVEPARRYDFTNEQWDRIKKIVEEWPHGFSVSDRRWLQPLLAQFSEVDAIKNGIPVALGELR